MRFKPLSVNELIALVAPTQTLPKSVIVVAVKVGMAGAVAFPVTLTIGVVLTPPPVCVTFPDFAPALFGLKRTYIVFDVKVALVY